MYGIYLCVSSFNTISGNILIGNGECIFEYNYHDNTFSDNYCPNGEGDGGIPFGLIISILSIIGGSVMVITILLLNRRKRKRA